jgi:hypothetical protein
MLIEDPDCGLGKIDGDCLASMAEADLDALDPTRCQNAI